MMKEIRDLINKLKKNIKVKFIKKNLIKINIPNIKEIVKKNLNENININKIFYY
jgi:hypothetical protein